VVCSVFYDTSEKQTEFIFQLPEFASFGWWSDWIEENVLIIWEFFCECWPITGAERGKRAITDTLSSTHSVHASEPHSVNMKMETVH